MGLGVIGIGRANQLDFDFFLIFGGFFGDFGVFGYTTKIGHYLEIRIPKKNPRVNLEEK